jgi:hypothetical protein
MQVKVAGLTIRVEKSFPLSVAPGMLLKYVPKGVLFCMHTRKMACTFCSISLSMGLNTVCIGDEINRGRKG